VGKETRIARKTKGKKKIRVSHERPRREPEYFAFINGGDIDFTSRTRWFYELCLRPDRRD
jgi:hypothetical protein